VGIVPDELESIGVMVFSSSFWQFGSFWGSHLGMQIFLG